MRRTGLIIGMLLACGCQRVSYAADNLVSPPAAYAHFSDRWAARMLHWGIPWSFPCVRGVSSNVAAILSDHECYRFGSPHRYRGLWRDDAEGARFCMEPATICEEGSPGERTYLAFSADKVIQLPIRGGGALYYVDFIGRPSVSEGRYGNGNVGSFDREIMADRMISVKELEPPAKQGQDDTLK